VSAKEASLLPPRLVEGYSSFLAGRFSDEQTRYRRLAEAGQSPRVMLIGCCDSRVAPEVIFDASPGEIFVVRNVANLMPPYAPNDDLHGTSAALEYAVMGLRVEHIVVMGHAQCGGVRAFASNEADPYQRPLSPGDFIGKWITLMAPAAEQLGRPDATTLDAYIEQLARLSIKQSLANLRTFPCVRILEERGKLHLHGAFFGVADGRLLALDEASGDFVEMAAADHRAAFATPRF
jgi:carbonic anhydrase